MNEQFVCDQGRPRGAARSRPDLHGRGAGDRPGSGGWPMSRVSHAGAEAVLRRHVFAAATTRDGHAGLRARARRCAERGRTDREQIRRATRCQQIDGDRVRRRPAADAAEPSSAACSTIAAQLRERAFDSQYGGFGSAPKFPRPMVLDFLLRRHARTSRPSSARHGARRRSRDGRGGIHDQLGGGFARYSVDAAGACRISRRCSTTRRCCCARMCARSRSPAMMPSPRQPPGSRTGCCVKCAGPRVASTARSTQTAKARRALLFWTEDELR